MKTRNGLQNCRTRRTLCTAVFDSILKNRFYLCAPWSISRQSVKSTAESTSGTQNRRTEAYTSRLCRTQTAQFFSSAINPCEIHENFHCKPNALHCPVIHQRMKPLHRDVVYPTVPHDLAQNDEADRVLLRIGHHGRKSERICGTEDFLFHRTPALPIRNHTTRNYGGKN